MSHRSSVFSSLHHNIAVGDSGRCFQPTTSLSLSLSRFLSVELVFWFLLYQKETCSILWFLIQRITQLKLRGNQHVRVARREFQANRRNWLKLQLKYLEVEVLNGLMRNLGQIFTLRHFDPKSMLMCLLIIFLFAVDFFT
ncbi:hypothetical protein DsansV1_C11g0113411 [Dioscorea sansibarensis]